MAIVEIVKAPNNILLQKCQKVKSFDENLEKLVQNLIDTLNNEKDPEGVGLAAPQIGVDARVCIVRRFFLNPISNKENDYLHDDYVLINPRIVKSGGGKDLDIEGCLSIPGVWGNVERDLKIKVRYFDIKGNMLELKAEDFFAREIQHEVDHLDGVLFTSKVIGKLMNDSDMENA